MSAIGCHVCGSSGVLHRQNRKGRPGIWACSDHRDRIKCAIDTCRRTTKGEPISEWICAEHWRRYCPPRSARRRAYLAFFRKAKRQGWDDDMTARYWRIWDGIVGSARARAARGSIDTTEINKLFGWVD